MHESPEYLIKVYVSGHGGYFVYRVKSKDPEGAAI